MASDDVMDRVHLVSVLNEEADDPSHLRSVVLAHDAALRARIEELEATVREELCDCGPAGNPDLDEHADYCRARRALESDPTGGRRWVSE